MSHKLPAVVTVYDPNHVNPYGSELASTIVKATSGVVNLYCPQDRDLPKEPNVALRATLSPRGQRLFNKILRRLWDPISVAVSARASPLIVVWTRDIFDAAVFTMRGLFGAPTYFILHNPQAIRPRRGLAGVGERILLRSVTVCVHSSNLAKSIEGSAKSIHITPHPSYFVTTSAHPHPIAQPKESKPTRPQIALLGALRPDKGLALLPEIARSSGGGWDCVVIGPDRVSTEVVSQLRKFDVGTVHPFTTEPSDAQVIEWMGRCDVMIAPYSSVTESGSVILAHTVGLPAIALKSPALSQTLFDRAQASNAEALGNLLRSFLLERWPTYAITPLERQEQAISGWREALQ